LIMATSKGEVKKVAIDAFSQIRSSGLIAVDLPENDSLIAATLANDENEIIMISQMGQSIRFNVSELRASQRASGGVLGFKLDDKDRVVSLDVVDPQGYLLVATTLGFGKITPLPEYPNQHRAGSGVRTFHTTDKTGLIAAARVVDEKSEVMLVSANGIITRTPVKEEDPRKGITVQGRSTQGVKLMKLDEGDTIVAITCLKEELEEEKTELTETFGTEGI